MMGSIFSRKTIRPKLQVNNEENGEKKTRKPSLKRALSSKLKNPKGKKESMRKKPIIRIKPRKIPSSMRRDASAMSMLTPCTRSFIEVKKVPKGNTKRDRRKADDQDNTKAEKPKKKPKTKRYTKRQQSLAADNTQDDDSSGQRKSAYMQNIPTERTSRDVGSISCPILETACEENAFITEHANKGQPKIDNFFEMADPFAKEDDMLDISDTIFDVANEFPDIYLRGRLVAPSKSEFKIIVSGVKTSGTIPTVTPAESRTTMPTIPTVGSRTSVALQTITSGGSKTAVALPKVSPTGSKTAIAMPKVNRTVSEKPPTVAEQQTAASYFVPKPKRRTIRQKARTRRG